jgi:hypothetical protein
VLAIQALSAMTALYALKLFKHSVQPKRAEWLRSFAPKQLLMLNDAELTAHRREQNRYACGALPRIDMVTVPG